MPLGGWKATQEENAVFFWRSCRADMRIDPERRRRRIVGLRAGMDDGAHTK